MTTNEKSMCRRSPFGEQDEFGRKKMSAKAEGDPSGEGRRFGSSQYGSQKHVSGLSLSRRGQ